MEEQREESGDCREPMEEEVVKGLGLSSKTETLAGDDGKTVAVSDLGVSEENPNDGGLATGDGSLKAVDVNTGNSISDEKQEKAGIEDLVGSVKGEESKTVCSGDVEMTDAITEPDTELKMECKGDIEPVKVKLNDETAESEDKRENGASHGTAGQEETVTSAADVGTDEKTNCEVEDKGGSCDAEQDVETEISQHESVDGETLSVAEDRADQEKEITKKSEEDFDEMGGDSKLESEGNIGLHEHAEHSESVQVQEESVLLSKEETNKENPGPVSEVSDVAEICREEEITTFNQKEEGREAMEIDNVAEEHVEKDFTVGGLLDDTGVESAGAVVQTEAVTVGEVDNNDIEEHKDNADMTSDFTGKVESADSANQNSTTEVAASGEVELLDHNALFDPSSDITNFIDFSGVSSWSGNIKDIKTVTRDISLKEDKKATDMAEEVQVTFGAESATDCSKDATDKDHEFLAKKTADQQDAMREEDIITHEAPSLDSNRKDDIKMEDLNNFDYADDQDDSNIKTNGVKRKADVLTEDSQGEGRKTVSLAKVSFAQRPSFKIGACIARAASQMAGSHSALKGSNLGDETLSVESFVSQLHCAATNPVKENVVSDLAVGFFFDFRNSSASEQFTPEKVSSKRARHSNSNTGGTEAFEFEEMGDTYWTDRVIHNGGEEQATPTEKGNYQVVPVELKPAQVQRSRRPYRRRQSQIIITHSASKKLPDFDENAPAELIINFSETDTIPPEKSLCKMFKHFGPIQESQTEVDSEKHRARVVFKKGADAEVAYNSAGRFNIFGTKAVNYELSHTITETFKVQPYVVSLGEENAALCPPT